MSKMRLRSTVKMLEAAKPSLPERPARRDMAKKNLSNKGFKVSGTHILHIHTRWPIRSLALCSAKAQTTIRITHFVLERLPRAKQRVPTDTRAKCFACKGRNGQREICRHWPTRSTRAKYAQLHACTSAHAPTCIPMEKKNGKKQAACPPSWPDAHRQTIVLL